MKDWDFALQMGKKVDFLMECQARTGIQFDYQKAEALWEFCRDEMRRIEEEVEPRLPEKPLNKEEQEIENRKVTPPKVQLKNSKEGLVPSVKAHEFFDALYKKDEEWYGQLSDRTVQLPHEGPIIPPKTTGVMRLSNQKELKDWLLQEGWKPTFWNYKRGPGGKILYPKVKTTPKFHDQGTICPNLEQLGEVVEIVRPIVRWLSLRNRKSVIWNPEQGSGWLSDNRLQNDGRLSAGCSGVTYTLRQKHKRVANIPRVTSYLGKEMRSLFCARPGMKLVGYDASSLEDYTKGHFVYNYPGGREYFEMITDPGYDAHQTMADKCNLKSRQDAKPINYGLQYNQQPKGLAESQKVPIHIAERWFNEYWEINKPWKLCLDKLAQHWQSKDKRGIYCPVTGYFLRSRSKHSLGSLLIQHTGAIIMDLSGLFMDKWLGGIKYDSNNLPFYKYKGHEVRRVVYYHDEYAWECHENISKEILDMGIKSIVQSGQFLNLNVPLYADGAIGDTWGDIH